MKIRHGVCSSCGARYQIPASFQADRARCKQCGGVTEIGPAVDEPQPPARAAAPGAPPLPAAKVPPATPPKAAPAPVVKPAAKPAAKPIVQPAARPPQPAQAKGGSKNDSRRDQKRGKGAPPAAPREAKPAPPRADAEPAAPKASEPSFGAGLVEVKGSGKKREGPSMREQLLARRAAEAKRPDESGGSSVKSGVAKSMSFDSQPQERRDSKSATKAAARAGDAARGTSRAVAAAGAKAAAPASSSSKRGAGKRGGAAARGRRGEEENEETRTGGRRGARGARQKKSPVPALVGIGLLVLAGGGAWFYSQKSNADEAAAGSGEVLAKGTPAGDAAVDPAAAAAGSSDETATPVVNDAQPVLDDVTGAAAAAAPDVVEPESAPEAPKPAAASSSSDKDPDSVDLTKYEDFGPAPGGSQETFDELTADMATFVDPGAGAAGSRARKRLFAAGIEAFPVIVNSMKSMDFTTKEGYQNGDIAQGLIREMLGGMSYGWKYSTEPGDVYYNKKTVENYIREWNKVVADPEYWKTLTQKVTSKENADGQ